MNLRFSFFFILALLTQKGVCVSHSDSIKIPLIHFGLTLNTYSQENIDIPFYSQLVAPSVLKKPISRVGIAGNLYLNQKLGLSVDAVYFYRSGLEDHKLSGSVIETNFVQYSIGPFYSFPLKYENLYFEPGLQLTSFSGWERIRVSYIPLVYTSETSFINDVGLQYSFRIGYRIGRFLLNAHFRQSFVIYRKSSVPLLKSSSAYTNLNIGLSWIFWRH